MEAQNHLLEKQRAETGKALVEEKRGMELSTSCTDSFALGLISTLVGLENLVRALKRDLVAREKANTDLQNGRDAAEAREGATEGKLRLERQASKGMVRKPPCIPFE